VAAEATRALLRAGVPFEGYARRIADLYGAGEPSWLRRRLADLPDAVAKVTVRLVLGSAAARRRVVFGSIFGMRESEPQDGRRPGPRRPRGAVPEEKPA
jgi:hypothetical protein